MFTGLQFSLVVVTREELAEKREITARAGPDRKSKALAKLSNNFVHHRVCHTKGSVAKPTHKCKVQRGGFTVKHVSPRQTMLDKNV